MHVATHGTTRYARRITAAVVCVVAGAGVGCRQPDLTQSAAPAAATSLALYTQPQLDTARVHVTLGGDAPVALGSFTAEVAHAGAWQFAQCDAVQAQALLACKAHGETVRVAAAWAGGTHAGTLVTLTFVRSAPSATPLFAFVVSEAHGARGENVLEHIDVRRQSVAVGGAQ
ncbi:hypothetical protein [Gemmatimonas sp.]